MTFSYESQLKKRTPVEPRILRVRTDLSWSNVMHFFSSSEKSLNGMNRRERGREKKRVNSEINFVCTFFSAVSASKRSEQ